jgi:hypothetical protein
LTKRFLVPILLLLSALAVPASSQAFKTGIGDENATAMFGSKYFKPLHVRYVRYFVPFDAMNNPYTRRLSAQWIDAANKAGAEPLIAFYHSEYHPRHLPSVKEYTADVKAFEAAYPTVHVYTPWNEANHAGGKRFANPSARQSAAYYEALRSTCTTCTIVGLDVLDTDPRSTIKYVRDFTHAVKHKPRIWGLHNYTDTNRFHSTDTRAIIRYMPGQVWLTETGGLVSFGRSFPNKHNSGLKRAAKALQYMFRLASAFHQIQRVYVYAWTTVPHDVFDAGLVDSKGKPRPGYYVVRDWLHKHH